MELYTNDEANFIISYYKEKVVGQVLERSTNSIVEKLDKEDYGDEKYRVIAIGHLLSGFIRPKRSIELVARDLNLISPNEAINDFKTKF